MKVASTVLSWIGGILTVSYIFIPLLAYGASEYLYIPIIYGIFVLIILIWRQVAVACGHKVACGVFTLIFVSLLGGILTLCISESELKEEEGEKTIKVYNEAKSQVLANSNAESKLLPVAKQNAFKKPAWTSKELPSNLYYIPDHAFSKNTYLEIANIQNGVRELGIGAFANCLKLKIVVIPRSITRISSNCFFNCVSLKDIEYLGTKEEFLKISKGTNWLTLAGTNNICCSNGKLIVE